MCGLLVVIHLVFILRFQPWFKWCCFLWVLNYPFSPIAYRYPEYFILWFYPIWSSFHWWVSPPIAFVSPPHISESALETTCEFWQTSLWSIETRISLVHLILNISLYFLVIPFIKHRYQPIRNSHYSQWYQISSCLLEAWILILLPNVHRVSKGWITQLSHNCQFMTGLRVFLKSSDYQCWINLRCGSFIMINYKSLCL